MNPKPIFCLLLLVIILTGCQAENIQESHGQAVNLRGDHRSENIQLQNDGEGFFKDGVSLRSFTVGQSNWLTLFYTNQPNQMSQPGTNSYLVHGWLMQNQPPESLIHLEDKMVSAKSPENYFLPAAEPLHGSMELGYAGWRHKNHFHVKIDLAGDSGLTLKAEFKSYDRIDPNSFWEGPIVLFGMMFGLAE